MTATLGYDTELCIVKETTPGTTPAITGAQREYFTDDPNINPVQTTLKLPTIGARHERKPVVADYHIEASLPIIVTPEGSLGTILTSALGDDTPALVGTTAYTHTFAPSDSPSTLSIWFKYGTTFQRVINYCVVNTLEFSQDLDDALRVSASIIAMKDATNADDMSTAEAYDTLNPFMNANLTVTGPSNAAECHKSTISINNGYNVNDGKVHGSRFFNQLIPGKRSVTGSFDVWFDDDGDYQSFWGSSSAAEPSTGTHDTVELNFKWDMADDFDATYDHTLEIKIPEATYESTSITVGNRVKQTVNWMANYDTADAYEIQIILQNAVSSEY